MSSDNDRFKKWYDFLNKHPANIHPIHYRSAWTIFVPAIACGLLEDELLKQTSDDGIKDLICGRLENVRQAVHDDLLKLINEVRAV